MTNEMFVLHRGKSHNGKDFTGHQKSYYYFLPHFDLGVDYCIFSLMKVSASIMAGIFILVVSLLHLQPLFNYTFDAGKEEESCASTCQMANPCGNKEEEPADEENSCPLQACNPFVPCAMSSCCYLVENFFPGIKASIAPKIKRFVFDDKRLLNQSSECWHPPEAFS